MVLVPFFFATDFLKRTCPKGYRKCADMERECFYEGNWCNGLVECHPGGEDESNCGKPPSRLNNEVML